MKKVYLFLSMAFFSLMSMDVAMALIPENQTQNFEAQLAVAKDIKKPLSVRWQALLKSSELANYEQMQKIKDFTHDSDWFMRNAALVSLQKIGLDHAVDPAKVLLKDKALVVRSAAVDVLAKKLTLENRQLLAQEMDQSYNFKKSKSLWIRPKIFEIIAANASFDDRLFFVRHLFDSDEMIQKMSVQVLEKITEVKLSSNQPVKEWQNYVKKKGWF